MKFVHHIPDDDEEEDDEEEAASSPERSCVDTAESEDEVKFNQRPYFIYSKYLFRYSRVLACALNQSKPKP